MPQNSVAPMAFLSFRDLLADYTDIGLISSISTMETSRRFIALKYNANSVAGKIYKPSIKNEDYSLTRVEYDREERSRLVGEQVNMLKSISSNLTSIFLSWSANFDL
jgi:hypothetical protein